MTYEELRREYAERDGDTDQSPQLLSAVERVAFYERLFDEVSSVVQEERPLPDELRHKVLLLEEYYTSGEWRKDYEADEAGLFPADLKRGVLSQDGLFDLLEQTDVRYVPETET